MKTISFQLDSQDRKKKASKTTFTLACISENGYIKGHFMYTFTNKTMFLYPYTSSCAYFSDGK